jgi:glutamate dehydrogenase
MHSASSVHRAEPERARPPAEPGGSEQGLAIASDLLVADVISGYISSPFPQKASQQAQVTQVLSQSGFMPNELVSGEVDWFYNGLGIDNGYFISESPSVIADHVLALYSAKLLAYTKHDPEKLVIDLESVTTEDDVKAGAKEGAVFIHSSAAGVSARDGPGATVERRIDQLFLDKSTADKAYRLETYRSAGSISTTISQQLRCYFVAACEFPKTAPVIDANGDVDIRSVSDASFLEKATPNTLEIYQSVMNEVSRRRGPVIELFGLEESREHRVVIGYKMGDTKGYFAALSDLYHFYNLYSARKYVEQFANGVTIISLYLNPAPNTKAPPIEHSIHQVVREASLLYCLPDNPFFQVAEDETPHAVQEATYAYIGWIFAQHFCNRLGASYMALKDILDESKPDQAEVLNRIKTRFREETFTRESIREVITAHPDLIRMLYINFAMVHYPAPDEASQLTPTLSFQRLKTEQPLSDTDLLVQIRKRANNTHASQILEAFLIFNKHVVKCNFYQPTKVALSFRLNPGFLNSIEYTKQPYGVFLVVGSDFRGFHVRFRDVARGGIRLVRSRGKENYNSNVRTIFDENYNLAATQTLKNKDIPEGGSKGTILPSLGANPRLCFERYIDALIDLLLPGQSPGIKGPIVDVSGRPTPEILFLGPDEGTADLMDWAALHAKSRSAPWWKSFTTGKSAEKLGGIPHDVYGMTSLSVRQYILGVYQAHGLNESEVTKLQTGGPDGDLGSNEILLSKDKTVGIIDGSGVIYDPEGLNRPELIRLAKGRKMIVEFDDAKLGPQGYKVLVDQQDVKLPSGEIVPDGTAFRNDFHFRVKCDIFVPCGGRPEAVNIGNVARLTDEDGKPNFKYVVEGANLFFSQQARFWLEKKGVVLFKDSSTNKGGVTSSSLEVLAGLAQTDAEYHDNMIFKNGKKSAFYEAYVKDIQKKICENAAAEYKCIDKEWKVRDGAMARTAISDLLSTTLNRLQDDLEASPLYDDNASRHNILASYIPKTLQDKIGLDELIQRLPEAYLRALWSARLSSAFVYTHGIEASMVDFYLFVKNLSK